MIENPIDVVNEQANDESLWFIPVYVTEDILQRALRRLHAAIDGGGKMVEPTTEECLEVDNIA